MASKVSRDYLPDDGMQETDGYEDCRRKRRQIDFQ